MGKAKASVLLTSALILEAIIVEKTGSIFLAGSYLVKAAIGEDVDNEFLGGAETHSEISGVTDYKMKNDKAALDKIRNLVEKIGINPMSGFQRTKTKNPTHQNFKKSSNVIRNGSRALNNLPKSFNTT